MTAEIIKINSAMPEEAYSRAREVIQSGGVIAYPTETFYGLGADPNNRDAVRKIFDIKGRPADQPVLLLIPDVEDVLKWAREMVPASIVMMNLFWPGPLTLVLPARADVIPEITAGTGKIGLRVPGSRVTVRLLAALGTALTGTSANIAGGGGVRTAQEAAEGVGGRVDLILDGGTTPGGKPSTVLDMTVNPPRLLREGVISLKELSIHIGVVS